ncbi:hypothetical protein AHX05_12045 [Salmonella enterica subsp. indica]|uniref:hypothetical protein n=1 Tax=Enterobacter hormaechei TaxID=158836 RepID=UPI0012C19B86|nr:hypothetical protein [Salmonella enterica subsp. indica]EBP3212673.1 hypothetical protein [Salmonella enterica subsp. arizonae]EEJ9030752.1 hypothetical protein [Salmonella enterica subsp. enterica serovar Oslo]EHN2302796.1 hypothetical protein [Salmonella enterica]MCE1540365.1 hypothetical protein [Enterobacter hormaechei]
MYIDADFISLGTLVANQQAAKWAGVAAVAACLSCVVTTIGLLLAWRSLHQWKPQYKENSRLLLIEALIAFHKCLINIPKNLDNDPDYQHRKEFLKASAEVDFRGQIYLKQHSNEKLKDELELLRSKCAEFVGGKVIKPELSLISNIILLIDV